MLMNDLQRQTTAVRRWLMIADLGPEHSFHVGDEAMFDANLRLVRKLCPQAQLAAVSGDPEFTSKIYGIRSLPRLGFDLCSNDEERDELLQSLSCTHWTQSTAAAFDALSGSQDGLIIAGGGNLRSTWPAYLYERLALVRKARSHSAPVILLGQTLGPNLNERHRAMLSEILCAATWVGVREMASYQLALDLGIGADRLSYQVDDAHSLVYDDSDFAPPFLDTPWMAVTFHPLCDPFGDDPLLDALARQIENACSLTGCAPVFIPHARANEATMAAWSDEDMGNALAARMRFTTMRVLPVLPAAQVARLTAQASLTISSRYHPLVFALAAAKLCFGVCVDEYTRIKLQGALRHYACTHALFSLKEMLRGDLTSSLQTQWSRRGQIQNHLAERGQYISADELRRQAALQSVLANGELSQPIPRPTENELSPTRQLSEMDMAFVDEPPLDILQLQCDLAIQKQRASEVELYARELLESNNQRQEMLDTATEYARSLERELEKMRRSKGLPEDEKRLTAAAAQMREEILELNRALKFAYEQMHTGQDVENSQLQAQVAHLSARIDTLSVYEQTVKDVNVELWQLRAQVTHLSARVDALLSSASWRITQPLRRLYDVFAK